MTVIVNIKETDLVPRWLQRWQLLARARISQYPVYTSQANYRWLVVVQCHGPGPNTETSSMSTHTPPDGIIKQPRLRLTVHAGFCLNKNILAQGKEAF